MIIYQQKGGCRGSDCVVKRQGDGKKEDHDFDSSFLQCLSRQGERATSRWIPIHASRSLVFTTLGFGTEGKNGNSCRAQHWVGDSWIAEAPSGFSTRPF